ncbi:hypothetical protein VIGAN_01376100 [Vigna angularis var. angularis]|uniref:Uncharacterized protein n=1 Tax=Vigna angularis var. angularis TaxID=157739 RepID=A0A0S3R5G5_PHAAN|nr:hypothetical protein VIGAN_01376100 [Vigna angularis var. angularis]
MKLLSLNPPHLHLRSQDFLHEGHVQFILTKVVLFRNFDHSLNAYQNRYAKEYALLDRQEHVAALAFSHMLNEMV